jgi:undecaprenyl-diphosphatase
MIEVLYSIDVALFHFLNSTLASRVGDVLWPVITDYDKLLPVRIVLLGVWLWLLIKGGVRGRTAALLLIPVLIAADKFSSALLKEWIARPRPCHEINGVPVVAGIRMLVDCGPGKSFPSSHAVNNFAVATLFSRYYPRIRYWVFGWAALIAISRPAVGVHYPSDILGGAIIGIAVALAIVVLWRVIQRRFFPAWDPFPNSGDAQ